MTFRALIACLVLSACVTTQPLSRTGEAPSSAAVATPGSALSTTRPTSEAPQTFEVQAEGQTWRITHETQKGVALHVPSGKRFVLWETEDPSHYADEHGSYGFTARLVSVVGRHLTFEVSEGGYSEGAAHGFAVHKFTTVDLTLEALEQKRWGRSLGMPLEALFGPALEAAIDADPVVQRARESQDMCSFDMGGLWRAHYGFLDVDGGQVTVLVGLRHGCEVSRGAFTQFRFTFPTPESLAAPLQRAEASRLLARHLRPKNDWADGAE